MRVKSTEGAWSPKADLWQHTMYPQRFSRIRLYGSYCSRQASGLKAKLWKREWGAHPTHDTQPSTYPYPPPTPILVSFSKAPTLRTSLGGWGVGSRVTGGRDPGEKRGEARKGWSCQGRAEQGPGTCRNKNRSPTAPEGARRGVGIRDGTRWDIWNGHELWALQERERKGWGGMRKTAGVVGRDERSAAPDPRPRSISASSKPDIYRPFAKHSPQVSPAMPPPHTHPQPPTTGLDTLLLSLLPLHCALWNPNPTTPSGCRCWIQFEARALNSFCT